jgi:hypothetical protein
LFFFRPAMVKVKGRERRRGIQARVRGAFQGHGAREGFVRL